MDSKGTVFYLPPAIGFRHSLDEEFATLRRWNICPVIASPTEIDLELSQMERGLKSPQGEIAFWERYVNIVAMSMLEQARPDRPVYIVGFNLGGSLAAYLARRLPIDGLIAVGSVPRLSEFWLTSHRPAAVAARLNSVSACAAYQMAMRSYDLTSSIHLLANPVLLQFGVHDDWIQPSQLAEIKSIQKPSFLVKLYDDNHDMGSAACVQDRCHLIRSGFDFEEFLAASIGA